MNQIEINKIEDTEYKMFTIVNNAYDEFNVCKKVGGEMLMVDSRASFTTLRAAKKYIDRIPLIEALTIDFYSKVK